MTEAVTGKIKSKEECFNGLAPEVKAFLDATNKRPMPPLNVKTYQDMRRLFASTMPKPSGSSSQFTGSIEDIIIPGPDGNSIPLRIYTPEGMGPFPVLLFYHGGAWVLGNLPGADDNHCTALASQTSCIVVSVDYRLAPEYPYPAAPEDCYTAIRWVAEKAHTFKGDGRRIAVSGESAGGNLATVVTLMSKNRGGPNISLQVLFYPATNVASGTDTESQRQFGEGFWLRRSDIEGARALYVPDEKNWTDPYVSPLLAKSLKGLPPALIITARCDPIRDEGEAYAERLQQEGVSVKCICYEDMIHGFIFLFRSAKSTRRALEDASTALREAFYTKSDSIM